MTHCETEVHQGVESEQKRRGQITYTAIEGPGFDVKAAEGPAGVGWRTRANVLRKRSCHYGRCGIRGVCVSWFSLSFWPSPWFLSSWGLRGCLNKVIWWWRYLVRCAPTCLLSRKQVKNSRFCLQGSLCWTNAKFVKGSNDRVFISFILDNSLYMSNKTLFERNSDRRLAETKWASWLRGVIKWHSLLCSL